jgi:hypothetical protein
MELSDIIEIVGLSERRVQWQTRTVYWRCRICGAESPRYTGTPMAWSKSNQMIYKHCTAIGRRHAVQKHGLTP